MCYDTIKKYLDLYSIKINGVLHIGAHDCEELDFYRKLNISIENIVWLEAITDKVVNATAKGIPNVYKCVVSDKDNDSIVFNIANNGQSSSILELGTHVVRHPEVKYTTHTIEKSKTIDTFFTENNLKNSNYNFWNLDIQGAELLALKGGSNSLQNVDVIYIEVNIEQLYKNCPLIADIDMFLNQYGFKRIDTVITEWNWGDALYIRIIR